MADDVADMPLDRLYVATPNPASRQAEVWRTTRPNDAAIMTQLGNVPTAKWFTGKEAKLEQSVREYVSAAAKAAAMPLVVAYNIPDRDAGQYSRGGASDAAAYNVWISGLARGIGGVPAIVILEPDALAHLEQLPKSNQAARYDMLQAAIDNVCSLAPNAAIYLDAGHPGWQTPSTMSGRLKIAGVQNTAGFSLNVSNFRITPECISYGTALSNLIGDKHFVIDTSRNGNGPDPDAAWCNPSGRALGQIPTLETGNPLVDALLWVKVPGESDGDDGKPVAGTSPPEAGKWWPEYALELARNAGWNGLQTDVR